MNALEYFIVYRSSKNVVGRAREYRGFTSGIAVNTDKYSLDFQAASCIERISEYHVMKELGAKIDYEICELCGYRKSVCDCYGLKARGIDPSTIRIDSGFVFYSEAKKA